MFVAHVTMNLLETCRIGVVVNQKGSLIGWELCLMKQGLLVHISSSSPWVNYLYIYISIWKHWRFIWLFFLLRMMDVAFERITLGYNDLVVGSKWFYGKSRWVAIIILFWGKIWFWNILLSLNQSFLLANSAIVLLKME